MTDLGWTLLAVVTLVIIGLAFKDARKADEEEAKLDQK